MYRTCMLEAPTVGGFPCSVSGVISTIHRENRGGWPQSGYLARTWGEVGAAGRWGAAVQAQPCPESTDLQRDVLGVPCPSRSSGSSTHCAQGLSFPVRQSHLCPEHFPTVISMGGLFQSECWDLTSSEQTRRATSSPCALLLVPIQLDAGEELLDGAGEKSYSQQWWPAVAHWSSNFVQVPGNPFPPSGVNQGCKERMGTTRICISSRCCHSAPGTRSGIILTLLPSVGCRCPEWSDGACPTVCGSDACLRNYFSRFLS